MDVSSPGSGGLSQTTQGDTEEVTNPRTFPVDDTEDLIVPSDAFVELLGRPGIAINHTTTKRKKEF